MSNSYCRFIAGRKSGWVQFRTPRFTDGRMRKIETKGTIYLTTLTKIKTDSESVKHQIDEIERLNPVYDNLGILIEILRSLYRI